MKQIIPFTKDIVFKTNIASITSISLEHEEKIFEGEVSGDFIVFGDYKVHNDTTEKELFKYRLPYTTLIPESIDSESIKIDIEDFTYEQIENDVIKVNIDYSIEGVELKEEKKIEIPEVRNQEFDAIIIEADEDTRSNLEDDIYDRNIFKKEIDIKEEKNKIIEEEEQNEMIEMTQEQTKEKEETEIIKEVTDEYITYHIHIVKENETLEDIIKIYETSLDNIKEYNELSNINIGDKIIIPSISNE